MTKKLPSDAFETYVAMGHARSYQALAEKYQMSKRAIVNRATRERWSERLGQIESQARVISDKKLSETLADMQERHAKTLRVMHARVIEALKEFPMTNCMDAIRAAESVIKLERLMAGEVSKRTELSIEEVTKREIHTLLTVVHDDASATQEARLITVGCNDEEQEGDDHHDRG
jgi:hypothetical protein